MKKQKFNFSTKIHLCCCSNDKLRPSLNYVHFIDGYVYTSNGYILIKQSLKLHNIFNSDLLNGKCIHKNAYAKILGYIFATATETGIECTTCQDKDVVIFKYSDNEIKPPDFESVLSADNYSDVANIKLKAEFINILTKSMYLPEGNIEMKFCGNNKAIKITALGVDEKLQMAMIIPIL